MKIVKKNEKFFPSGRNMRKQSANCRELFANPICLEARIFQDC